MTKRILKYFFLLILPLSVLSTSCRDDALMIEDPEVELDGANKVLKIKVTLDNMGGIQDNLGPNPMAKFENYIDPEKFRVLFFDEDDVFLFESKSRWVKKVDAEESHTTWMVSVPFYTFGNGLGDYRWDWDYIRDKMAHSKFKIAILANRPDREWNLGITDKSDNTDTIVKYGWFGNSGPYWVSTDTDVKTVFDLHHCQDDPIYDGKGWDNDRKDDDGNHFHPKYYDFISERNSEDRPMMGATSSWVDWGTDDKNNKDPMFPNQTYRHSAIPSYDHPIPMYGYQVFDPIPEEEWLEGTTFMLDRDDIENPDRPIALLRSVVRVELLVPKDPNYQIDFVYLQYPNVYARCEPMNTWTPTDELWDYYNDHGTCEIELLQKRGPILRTNDPTFASTVEGSLASKKLYQKRMLWFYGAWKEKGWDFPTDVLTEKEIKDIWDGNDDEAWKGVSDRTLEYPKIFNSCIQRQSRLQVSKATNEFTDFYNDGYYHFIAYVGERNINDPGKLNNFGSISSGDPTVMYWDLALRKTKSTTSGTRYCVAVADYSKSSNYGKAVDKSKTYTIVNGSYDSANIDNRLGSNGYEKAVMDGPNSDSPLPYPLVRNHVYRIILGNPVTTRSGETEFGSVQSQELHSKKIGFHKHNKQAQKKAEVKK